MMKPIKMIIDTDPGIDDVMAILFAHQHPNIDLLGLTTVIGNGTLETVTRNALLLKKYFNLTCDVAKGADKPLQGEAREEPTFVHGDNGLGNIEIDEKEDFGKIDPRPACDYLIDQIRANPNEITLVAIGQLTNLALAIEKAPDIIPLVKQVIIMGGAFGYNGHFGNVTPVAEANIYGDPWAADNVLAAKWDVVIVGLDVTHQVIMKNEHFQQLKENSQYGQFIYDVSRFYLNFYKTKGLDNGCAVHDSSAVFYALHPELFKTIKGPVRVVTEGITKGQTIIKTSDFQFGIDEWKDMPHQTVCVDVNAQACLDLYQTAMCNCK